MTNILVVENDPLRIEAMRASLTRHLPDALPTFITNSPEAVAWLDQNLATTKLISLDHDLGADEVRDGKIFDPGNGRVISTYLGARPPVCPVIVHTDNLFVRGTMQGHLSSGGWIQCAVPPNSSLSWVEERWIKQVVEYLNLGDSSES